MISKAKIIHAPLPMDFEDFFQEASQQVDSKHSFQTSKPVKILTYKEQAHHLPFQKLFLPHRVLHLHRGTLHLIEVMHLQVTKDSIESPFDGLLQLNYLINNL